MIHSNPQNRRISTKDIAYSEVKKRIIEGTLKPGEPIVEEKLSNELGISRTPLREALQRLEFDTLVVRQVNGRLKVAPVSVKEVNEIFHVRSRLEGIAVLEATENATEEDLQKLSSIILSIKEPHGELTIDDIFYYGGQFHTYIYTMSQNATVSHILHQLNDHIHRYRRLIPVTNVERLLKTGDEHQHILDLMIKKDKLGAEQAMMEHILMSLEQIIESLQTYEVIE